MVVKNPYPVTLDDLKNSYLTAFDTYVTELIDKLTPVIDLNFKLKDVKPPIFYYHSHLL